MGVFFFGPVHCFIIDCFDSLGTGSNLTVNDISSDGLRSFSHIHGGASEEIVSCHCLRSGPRTSGFRAVGGNVG